MSVSHYSTVTILHAWTCLRSCQCEVWAAAGLVHEDKIRLTPLVDMYCMSLVGTVCMSVCARLCVCVVTTSPWTQPLLWRSAWNLLKCHQRAGGVMGNILKQGGSLCIQTNRLFCSIPWLWGFLTQLHKMSGHGEYKEKNWVSSIDIC